MNDNTKVELANEIINTMIANCYKKGLKTNNKELQKLLQEKKEFMKFNFEIIDKIINEYGPKLREGK